MKIFCHFLKNIEYNKNVLLCGHFREKVTGWRIIVKNIYWDLSQIHDIDAFCDEMEKVAKESFRVLKPGKYCAILMWDTRRQKMYQPMAFKVMERFLKTWFALKEDIIKVQHNCKATWFWVQKSKDFNFLLIMHEHLFIFKKLK